MTREEAIERLKTMRWEHATNSTNPDHEAFDMAIKALSIEPCEDAISRQAVLDLIYNSWKHNGVGENYGELSIDALKALPPVTPKQETVTEFADRCRECGSMIGRQIKQKMGRWIREKKHHKDDFQEFDYWDVRCSECGARKRIGWTNVRHCPMCGAKMEESK